MTEMNSPTRPLAPMPAMKKMDSQDRVMRLLVSLVAVVLVITALSAVVNFLQYQLLFRTFNGATDGSQNFVAGGITDNSGIMAQNSFNLTQSTCTGATIPVGRTCKGYTVNQKFGNLDDTVTTRQLLLDASRNRLYVVSQRESVQQGEYSLGYLSTSDAAPAVKWLANLGQENHSLLSFNPTDGNLYFSRDIEGDSGHRISRIKISGTNAALTAEVGDIATTDQLELALPSSVVSDEQGNSFWMAGNFDLVKYAANGNKTNINAFRVLASSKLRFTRNLTSDGKYVYASAYDPTSEVAQQHLYSVYRLEIATNKVARIGTADRGNSSPEIVVDGGRVAIIPQPYTAQPISLFRPAATLAVRYNTKTFVPTIDLDVAFNADAGAFVFGTQESVNDNAMFYFDAQGRASRIVGTNFADSRHIEGDAAKGSFYYIEQANSGDTIALIKLN